MGEEAEDFFAVVVGTSWVAGIFWGEEEAPSVQAEEEGSSSGVVGSFL